MDRLIGKTVAGKYVLQRLLGEGGMGRVYLGVELFAQRYVAIKLLQESFSEDPDFVSRMEREALAVRRVSHPNSVKLYEFGRDPLGVYLAMEYLQGESLGTRLSLQGRLSPEEAVSYLLQILLALSLCHAQGVVHRDLKPDNIMLCPSGAARVAKLLDFGIARLQDGPHVTRTGQILGTPAYMSPEQISGKGIGPASDLYSLGVILYELLTGRLPFEESSQLELFRKHILAPPPSLAQACPGAPQLLPFEPVLQKALQKSPQNRFASAEAFGEALVEALQQAREASAPPLAAATLPGALLLETLAQKEDALLEETLPEEERPEERTLSGGVAFFGPAETVLLEPPQASPPLLLKEEVTAAPPPREGMDLTQKLPALERAELSFVCRVCATEKMLPLAREEVALLPVSPQRPRSVWRRACAWLSLRSGVQRALWGGRGFVRRLLRRQDTLAGLREQAGFSPPRASPQSF